MARYFVDANLTTGANDGSSWEDAFWDLAAAVLGASAFDEFWVKENEGFNATITLTSVTFVQLYGGFSSNLTGTAGVIADRTGYTTINKGSDGLRGAYVTERGCVISRFIIQNALKSDNGAGVYARLGGVGQTFTLDNCIVEGCQSTGGAIGGGGVYLREGTYLINECEIRDNRSNNAGGGVLAYDGELTLNRCSIHDNQSGSTSSNSEGGGVRFGFTGAGVLEVDQCKIYDNRTVKPGGVYDSSGGGLRINVSATGPSYIRNSVIYRNTAGDNVGGINIASGRVRVINCTIAGNEAEDGAVGGIKAIGTYTEELTNCIVRDNVGSTNNIQVKGFPAGNVDYCNVGDKADDLGSQEGTGCVDEVPVFLGVGDDAYQLTVVTPVTTSAGGSDGVSGYANEDYLGVERPTAAPSMGAYELVPVVTETDPAYTSNRDQQGDVYMYQGPEGGDIVVSDGYTELTTFFETAVYLTLFGGNQEDDGSEATSKLQWWGNEGEIEERQYRGTFHRITRGRPLTSGNLVIFEEYALNDLSAVFLPQYAQSIDVSFEIAGSKRLNMRIDFVTKTGESYAVNLADIEVL